MLGWIFSTIKWAVFAVAILVLGHVVQWRERSISDHIKSTISHFDPPPALPAVTRKVSQAIKGAERFSKEERARLDKLLSGQSR
jgi:hypothetical protein